ncbi:MAG TPA: HD domain-containing protein [Desulfosporosinus sp.]|nr:HD domain-containing protein [Desulfosporosinus sp.]
MLYRVHQFIDAIFPHINPSEITWALNNIPSEACSLFLKQSLTEQRHALSVAQSIMNEKDTLTPLNFQNLLTAALLHDCGKSTVSNRLWHRVFIVIIQKMPQSIWSQLERGHTVFAAPLKTSSQHAIWGSDLAERAGLNPVICLLIQEHHSPKTELGRILESVDNTH